MDNCGVQTAYKPYIYNVTSVYAGQPVPKFFLVPCPGKGECTDPRSGDAIFGVGGPGPPTTDNEHQLSLDRGEEKT
jgi:hypothetical protein